MSAYTSKLSRVRATSATGSFPSKVPTATQPSGAGVVGDPVVQGAPQWIQVIPFGDGADDSTFDLRVIGWKVSDLGLWVPTILAQAACTLSTAVGVDTYEVTSSQRFADTISLTQVRADVDSKLSSPTGNLVGSFQVETRGSAFIEVTFNLGTATGANALISWV
ncbi:hypothetical protein EBT16_01665 [bacterium]|nr:hypothetical protein [bacterium]